MKPKFTTRFGLLLLCILASFTHVINSASAQNPNWTLPGDYYQPDGDSYLPLPQSPPDPDTGIPETDPTLAYQGDPAIYASAGYTGPDGELMVFVVDAKVYDHEGWLIGELRETPLPGDQYTRQGYSEMMVIPMGNSCSRFAILFPSSAENIIGPGSTSQLPG